jgi:pSer/pThr/pTyr-binding forkhead associated (FHA) protein
VTDDPKKETDFLNTPESQPMQDRPPRPQTNILGEGWKLQVKIGDKKIPLSIEDTMSIGRTIDGEEPQTFALDLATFEGYQNGVSRHHATITRHEGALYIEDMGSTNGTRINGFQLTPRRKYRLRDGDEVEFARLRTLIRFIRPTDQG